MISRRALPLRIPAGWTVEDEAARFAAVAGPVVITVEEGRHWTVRLRWEDEALAEASGRAEEVLRRTEQWLALGVAAQDPETLRDVLIESLMEPPPGVQDPDTRIEAALAVIRRELRARPGMLRDVDGTLDRLLALARRGLLDPRVLRALRR